MKKKMKKNEKKLIKNYFFLKALKKIRIKSIT